MAQGQVYLSSSSSVLLMETALFAVDGYRMLSTHTLGTKPSSDECSNIAVTPNASTHYTRTRSFNTPTHPPSPAPSSFPLSLPPPV
ncbi:hypothetical protein QQF64_035599 [Cirrhinus molitorella]|uniref:Uncharacterized protein n=1 Tax=Cirrhinus molitorella TaxID=172907 RepID=A0ABR3NGY3_9TELE